MSFELNEQMVDNGKTTSLGGDGCIRLSTSRPVSGPEPLFKRFQTFLHTVDHDDDRFAHVFAVEAEWGRGKNHV